MSEQANPFGNEPNTGHIWDDNLRELTNPPPKWWMIGLHASWILVLAYSILYPTWPLISSHTTGILGWTSIKEYKEDLTAIEEIRAPYENKLKNMSAAAVLDDQDMTRYVTRSAEVLFGDYCAACHGAGGQGNPGYPVLADDDWLYGGQVNTIKTSITNGRRGMMPAMGGQKLTDGEIDELAEAIVAGNPTATPLYQSKGCIACHGPNGTGMHALGSANLNDSVWRFRSSDQLASVKYTIKHGVNDPTDPQTRNAEMPAFTDNLSETEIKKLAVYVHQLGGGQ